MGSSVRHWIYLFRLSDCLGALLSTCVGGYIAGADTRSLLMGGIIGMLVVAANNAINDVVGVESDRIDKSHRPIPAGKISSPAALVAGLSLALLALVLTLLFLRIDLLLYVAGATILGIFYSIALKRVPLLGHLVVAGLAGFTIIFGGLIVGNMRDTFFPALTISLILINREIMKTIEDIHGDASTGVRTIATMFGSKTALIVAEVVGIATILVSVIPFVMHTNHIAYLVLLTIGVDFPLIYGLVSVILKGTSSLSLEMYMRWTKVIFITGPIAFLFIK